MRVTIAKTHENLFAGEALSLTVPGTEGTMTVLPNHQAFVTVLKQGIALVRTQGGELSFPIDGGVLEVSANQATVLL